MIKIDPRFDRKRQLAQALIGRGFVQPPQQGNMHWSQGLAGVLSTLAGGLADKKNDAAEQQYRQEAQNTISDALNPDPVQVGEAHGPTQTPKTSRYDHLVSTLAGNPATSDAALKIQMQNELEKTKNNLGGMFAGTGIESQMLNIALDPNIPDSDPRKILAKQRLTRPQTVVTPTGTYSQPGYDLGEINGSSEGVTASPEQPPAFTPKKKTDAENQAGGYYDRMIAAQSELDGLDDYNPATFRESVTGLTNVTRSSKHQQFRQAADDWIRAKLRKESGAVIGDEEMRREYETYFPIYGDKPEVIEQKARARKVAEAAMAKQAGLEIDSKTNAGDDGWSIKPLP